MYFNTKYVKHKKYIRSMYFYTYEVCISYTYEVCISYVLGMTSTYWDN
jgi:hypothetical protein